MPAEELATKFGIVGVLDFVSTQHGRVKAAISLDGLVGELYLQGAQVTAWQPRDERPVLFTSPKSAFAPGRAIRGGIPIILPWFGPSRHAPTAPQHGFARTTTWHLDGVETAGSKSLTMALKAGTRSATRCRPRFWVPRRKGASRSRRAGRLLPPRLRRAQRLRASRP
jgi:glucose-6-phosphate 1-epimerase